MIRRTSTEANLIDIVLLEIIANKKEGERTKDGLKLGSGLGLGLGSGSGLGLGLGLRLRLGSELGLGLTSQSPI